MRERLDEALHIVKGHSDTDLSPETDLSPPSTAPHHDYDEMVAALIIYHKGYHCKH